MQDFAEIDLKELAIGLVKKWWLILLSALIIGGSAYVYTANFITPMYRATVTIYVNNISGSTESGYHEYISATNLATSQRLVTTYVNIIKSNTVLQKVIEQSGMDLTVEQVRNMMTASAVEDTEMFNVHVSNADPKLAAAIANVIADVAPDEIANILEGSSTKIIDRAEIPQYRYTPSFRKNTFLGCTIGVILAAVYIVLCILLDQRIKGEEDLDRLFNLPVLGEIPEFDPNRAKKGKRSYGYNSGYGKEAK